MSLLRKSVTAVATATIVLGLTYLVQGDGPGDPRAVRKANQASVNSVTTTANASGASIFGMAEAVDGPPAYRSEPDAAIIAVDTRFAEVQAPRVHFIAASPFDNCETRLTAVPRLAAMVELTLAAPCHPDADLVIWQSQIAFSARTDARGVVTMLAPALHKDATFVATLNNIEKARTTVRVADADQYDRAILQWRGKGTLQLHALEFGAAIGDPGHIWSASTHSPELAFEGARGFMTRLGTSSAAIPYWAEIYTYPTGLVSRDGQVKLQVGAAITEENCDRELDVKGIRTGNDGDLMFQEFEIQMPGCDMVGQSVLRADLFNSLTLAVR